MASNLDRYRKNLDSLLERGSRLLNALQRDCNPAAIEKQITQMLGEKAKGYIESLPTFMEEYQSWYSEAKVLIKQLLPDRLDDFTRHYEKPKSRKAIDFENYRIEDCLQGLVVTRGIDEIHVVGPKAAVPHVRQQLAIVESVRARFESSLFDIRQLVQADLFDSELEAASELAKRGFVRAAGAIAGVVLERHLQHVCGNHGIKVGKKAPSIADLNDALKKEDVVDVATWRFIQHLADIRNLCDHKKQQEPSPTQVDDLIAGVTLPISGGHAGAGMVLRDEEVHDGEEDL